MGKNKSNKRNKTNQTKTSSSSSLTINDLPEEVLRIIVSKLDGLEQLNCLNLTEGLHNACLATLQSSMFDTEVFIEACSGGKISAVRAILENEDAEMYMMEDHEFHCDAFLHASSSGNFALCEVLAEAMGGDICPAGAQAGLYGAVNHRHKNLAYFFLDEGASLNDETIMSLFADAVMENNIDLITFVLGLNQGSRSFDINCKGMRSHCYTALHLAVTKNNLEIVQCLLDHAADVNAKTCSGLSPIMMAKSEQITRLLLANRPDLSAIGSQSQNMLYFAAMNNNIVLAKEVLKCMKRQKIDINLTDEDGQSPLLAATSVEMIRLLMDAEADLHVFSIQHGTVLHNLCLRSTPQEPAQDLLDAIIKARVPLSATATSCERKTALHLAAEFGYRTTLKRLIDAGADINAQNTRGLTPLHLAASKNKKACVEALLEAGAATHIKSTTGKRARDLAPKAVKEVFGRWKEQQDLQAEAEVKKAAGKAKKKRLTKKDDAAGEKEKKPPKKKKKA